MPQYTSGNSYASCSGCMIAASKICLVMIVKNEEGVIGRCLESVRRNISHWVICDTGSNDRTAEVVHEVLKGIPGEFYRDAWQDFAHNRTVALRRAKGKADYHLMIDADMLLNTRGAVSERLTKDGYLLGFEGPLDFRVVRLMSDRHEWQYIGVAHEYLSSKTATTFATLPQWSLTHVGDGAAGGGPDKHLRYAALLEAAHEKEPKDARHVFYLAQSYRDAGRPWDAFKWYEKRSTMEGWDEETWHAKYQMARMMHAMGVEWDGVLPAYLSAYAARPGRIEPLYHIARHYREAERYELGYLFSRACVEAPYPDDFLFVERNVYAYELPMEYAICCYWTGRHDEAIRVNEQILKCPNLSENYRASAERNRQLSLNLYSLGG